MSVLHEVHLSVAWDSYILIWLRISKGWDKLTGSEKRRKAGSVLGRALTIREQTERNLGMERKEESLKEYASVKIRRSIYFKKWNNDLCKISLSILVR